MESFAVKEVTPDKGYLSKDNLELVAMMGGIAYIPFKVNSTLGEGGGAWEKTFLRFMLHREDFLRHYRARSVVPEEHAVKQVRRGPCPACEAKAAPG